MGIFIGLILVIVLFTMFSISFYYNSKIKEDPRFKVKGYNSSCKDCTITTCNLNPDYKEEDE